MLEPRLSRVLDDCLARLKAGEGLESCLASYPAYRGELGRLLQAASRLAGATGQALSPERKAANRRRLVGAIGASEASGKRQPRLSEAAIRRLIVVPTLIGALVLALFLGFGSSQAPDRASAATILTVLQGEVRVETGGGQVIARSGMQLSPGDRVVTSSGARAVLTFIDGSTVTLDSETVVVIRSVVDDGGQVRVSLSQPQGTTWTYVPPEISAANIEIDTPSASVQTDHAAFSTSVDTSGRTQVGAQEGSLAVSSGGQSTSVEHGNETTVASGVVAPPTAVQAPQRQLVVRISGPALAHVTDPGAATVGVLAPGIPVNQVPNATVVRTENEIVVTIPDPPNGAFSLGLQGQAAGDVSITATVSGEGTSSTISLANNDKVAVGINVTNDSVELSDPTLVSSGAPLVPAGVALTDQVVGKAQATATAATAIPTSTATKTPSPQPTATATPRPTFTPTATASATPTQTPAPTATPTPRPNIATPVRVPSNIDDVTSLEDVSPLSPSNSAP